MAVVENTVTETVPKHESNLEKNDLDENSVVVDHKKVQMNGTKYGFGNYDEKENGTRDEMKDLEELLSKLNPMAEEFIPTSLVMINGNNNNHGSFLMNGNFYGMQNKMGNGNANGYTGRRKKGNFNGKRRMNTRTSQAQREDVIRRTVYVSDIDQQVTEEQLAMLFINCGHVVDCRICGDPNSVLRFAFIEFTDEGKYGTLFPTPTSARSPDVFIALFVIACFEYFFHCSHYGARNALSLAGTMLGYYPVRVLPSKTAIAPVNPTFLPRSEDEREMCARTIYCTNIDKKVTQADVKLFFESVCGEVYRLRLLGDYHHSTRIAFVEFVMILTEDNLRQIWLYFDEISGLVWAESAIAALNCSGVVLGSLPIRVSPSKTPVRPRAPRAPIQ
ncbi:hypothetical protein IFM89_012545 [Coptis chinensis]|uniref:RRM domain-containing protein n=1 Tax=Coptis chinensis TaxID=261450 RepID=A0A835LVB3_9MAGN|nr:hypothetical protein IFM89_012545 [Coptis chinensis]